MNAKTSVVALALVAASLLAGCGQAPVTGPVLRAPQAFAARAVDSRLVLDGITTGGTAAAETCSAWMESLTLTVVGHEGGKAVHLTIEGQGGRETYCGVRMTDVCLDGQAITGAQAAGMLAQADASGMDAAQRTLLTQAQNLAKGGFVMLHEGK